MQKTSLNEVHKKQNGKMVEFAGFEMPVQYETGMLKEHNWVREGNVGLFDVSHMGQFFIEGENVVEFLNKITPTNFAISKLNQAKYTVLTNENGGIIDDLIITKFSDTKFFIVLNAACKEKDSTWIKKNLPTNLKFEELEGRSLIAIQGAKAESVLQKFVKNENLADLGYMFTKSFTLTPSDEIQEKKISIAMNKMGSEFDSGSVSDYVEQVYIGRTGYTGEDGFEVSISNDVAPQFWLDLCAFDEVKPIGLGARDSLRLEMGYPLYGHDLDDTTSPIEAGLSWVVSKSNLDFIGSKRVIAEKNSGEIARKRFGVKLIEKGIAREETEIALPNGEIIGKLTSGGFSPNLQTSIGQGYFDPKKVAIGDEVFAIVRGRKIKAEITSPTFVEAKTKAIKK